jgi:hypothetical protein
MRRGPKGSARGALVLLPAACRGNANEKRHCEDAGATASASSQKAMSHSTILKRCDSQSYVGSQFWKLQKFCPPEKIPAAFVLLFRIIPWENVPQLWIDTALE